MRFLLTNDDGVDAAGLSALRLAVEGWGTSVVAAPDREHSGCSHRVSGEPIRVAARGSHVHALGGTPVDCTRIGLAQLAPDADWVLAGINAGGNLGCDVIMSGTVAAVREAALLGRRAIAFSQYRKSREPAWNWDRCARWTRTVLDRLFSLPLAAGEFWNVNFPHLADEPSSETEVEPPIVFCRADTVHFDLSCEEVEEGFVYRNNYQARPRTEGHDTAICFGGSIAISKLTICSNAKSG